MERARNKLALWLETMQKYFNLPLLQSISDWQRGGDALQNVRRGQALKRECANLPEKYRECALCCFRQVALPIDGVWHLIGEDHLPEKISSWTLDIEVAKGFKGGVPPEGQGYQGVILCVRPWSGSVVVNLRELYQDPAFTAVLEHSRAAIVGYENGAGRFGSEQNEVVLEVAGVTQQDIYSMGGHSSSFEKLVDEAAELIYGPHATSEQREALLLKTEHVRSKAGPAWLDSGATQRVLTRTKPHARQLRAIKKMQDTR